MLHMLHMLHMLRAHVRAGGSRLERIIARRQTLTLPLL